MPRANVSVNTYAVDNNNTNKNKIHGNGRIEQTQATPLKRTEQAENQGKTNINFSTAFSSGSVNANNGSNRRAVTPSKAPVEGTPPVTHILVIHTLEGVRFIQMKTRV
jgi:hypothetical protein